jgi:hypothetical protein
MTPIAINQKYLISKLSLKIDPPIFLINLNYKMINI